MQKMECPGQFSSFQRGHNFWRDVAFIHMYISTHSMLILFYECGYSPSMGADAVLTAVRFFAKERKNIDVSSNYVIFI